MAAMDGDDRGWRLCRWHTCRGTAAEPEKKVRRTEVEVTDAEMESVIKGIVHLLLNSKNSRPKEGKGTKNISFTFKRYAIKAYRLVKAEFASEENRWFQEQQRAVMFGRGDGHTSG